MNYKKKLIEVTLPLDVINAASVHEKSIRHGHPSTLHLWWARRPLAAARAVIFASLVDDPSSHPDRFPTEESQDEERQRLFDILEQLVKWENRNDEHMLAQAKAEILTSTGNNPPALLDPFAGGGAIPLEAQRLGLKAHASDLNPVAVLINKAMIEIPPRFSNQTPVNPVATANMSNISWKGNAGLAEDVRYYGEWMKEEAFRRIGYLYPTVKVPLSKGGDEATVIAWIWARTVKCPNPVCGCEMPLARTFNLSTKKENEAYWEPVIEGKSIRYIVKDGKSSRAGIVNRRGAHCIACETPVDFSYIRAEGQSQRMGAVLVAIVAEGTRGRIYLSPTDEHTQAADINKPKDFPNASITYNPRDFRTPHYGMAGFADLFTNRQLVALVTFSDLVGEAMAKIEADAITAGKDSNTLPLSEGGSGAKAYGEAVGVYLAFVIDKLTDYHSSICSWNVPGEKIRNTFGRQAIPMVWDYAEANPFCNSTGSFRNMHDWVQKVLPELTGDLEGIVSQRDAQTDCGLREVMISTDPPYYDNIGYADLSDYFYIWLRRSLQSVYPRLFRTMLVPKADELVANPYRFDGDGGKARDFFEDGMSTFCQLLNQYTQDDIPVTIYYAYKQSETENSDSGTVTASTGWETMLSAIIHSGFTLTGTWPIRTERGGRTNSIGTNSLASSIVLVCRKRPDNAPVISRRDFIRILRPELRPALKTLQTSSIAPVDLAQSAIGPGIAVYSRYSQVLEADGSQMDVRNALQVINQELDAYFSEQDGILDSDSSFCVALYEQYGFTELPFGEADVLARAKNTSVSHLESLGAAYAFGGKVRLLKRDEMNNVQGRSDRFIWRIAQKLVHAMATGGNNAASELAAACHPDAVEQARNLVYRLFSIADQRNAASEALAYNNLITSWSDIRTEVRRITARQSELRQITWKDLNN